MGGSGFFCVEAVLGRKIAFVGPVEFDIDLPEGAPVEGFPEGFGHPVLDLGSEGGCIPAVYEVGVSFLDPNADDLLSCGAHGEKVFANEEFVEYTDGEATTRLHLYRAFGEKRAFLKTVLEGDRIRMYIPDEAHWPPGRKREIWAYLMLEKLLIKEGAVILHSASVVYKGGAVLFTAPSGTGKSTQADLWKKYAGAIGFNGDRNILMEKDGLWVVCGLPWSGTSPEHLNEVHPLKAIAVVRRAKEDSVSELSVTEKVLDISEGLTMNHWDREFMEKTFDILMPLAEEALIVQLNCTMEKSAVECLKGYIENGGGCDGAL